MPKCKRLLPARIESHHAPNAARLLLLLNPRLNLFRKGGLPVKPVIDDRSIEKGYKFEACAPQPDVDISVLSARIPFHVISVDRFKGRARDPKIDSHQLPRTTVNCSGKTSGQPYSKGEALGVPAQGTVQHRPHKGFQSAFHNHSRIHSRRYGWAKLDSSSTSNLAL